jgi:hypothetical protein
MRNRFNYCVLDCDGLPIRNFVTLEDAEFFIADKPDCVLKSLIIQPIKMTNEEFTKKFGEPLF